MNKIMKRFLLLLTTHGITLVAGFALGVYMLPILQAPSAPDSAIIEEKAKEAEFKTEFVRDLKGSDFLHWGEGTLSLTQSQVVYQGKLSPGPDYKLYLVDQFVDHEDEFLPIKSTARYIGDVKTFDGFILDMPTDVDLEDYTTALVWCEAFSEFITAGVYRNPT